jgi:lipoprotein-anchoring transpeptidase ErfK/SrfK
MRNAFLAVLAAAPLLMAQSSLPQPDLDILHQQVILDKLGFSSGVLDGREGESLRDALRGFQMARGLPVSGLADVATLKALSAYRNWQPTVTLTVSQQATEGPFTDPLPKEPEAQTKLPALNYRNTLEALAERFHTTARTIAALNPPGTKLYAGARIIFPNSLPTSRVYKVSDAAWAERLSSLNVDAQQPQAARIVVDKSDRVLRVYDKADKLVAQFPATMGSKTDPLPIGRWTIKGVSYNPEWEYNPQILKRADKSDPKMRIPSGPNNPVGVVWIDLSKPHYGIHGTNEPARIGRAESNGCIRLTNWDAARLSLMVKGGTPAVFQR